MSEYRDVIVFVDREEAKGGILALGRQCFANRGHRHGMIPKESARHFDVPFKS
jgi:hypothetical protein